MERITLPNAPVSLSPMDAAVDFAFGEGKYARVILEMMEAQDDNFLIKAQAYEMNADGYNVTAPKGYPSRTRQTAHTFPRSALGDTATLVPGWVRLPPASGAVHQEGTLPAGTVTVDNLPQTGTPGDMAFVNGTLYRWDKGIVQTLLETKVAELATVLKNSAPLSNLGFAH